MLECTPGDSGSAAEFQSWAAKASRSARARTIRPGSERRTTRILLLAVVRVGCLQLADTGCPRVPLLPSPPWRPRRGPFRGCFGADVEQR